MASTLMQHTVLHTAAAFNPMDYQSAWDQHLDMAKQMYTLTSGWTKQSHKVSKKNKNTLTSRRSLVHVAWCYKEKDSLKTKSCQHLE